MTVRQVAGFTKWYRAERVWTQVLLVVIAWLSFAGFGFSPAIAESTATEITLDGRTVTYWKPEGAESEKHPLILFSHAFHGCSTQSRYLTEALAKEGFWVFAPNHRDNLCNVKLSSKRYAEPPDVDFYKPQNWNDTTYAARMEDLKSILQALHNDPAFESRIDFSKTGLMGHSLGGYIVLGMAGAWPSWKLPDVQAVLALSPYSPPFNIKKTLVNITAPIMYQGGTKDREITPSLRNSGGSYDQSNPPKYYVEIQGASHFDWTNLTPKVHAPMVLYSVAFFNRYLKNIQESNTLSHLSPGVSQLRFATESETGELPEKRRRRSQTKP